MNDGLRRRQAAVFLKLHSDSLCYAGVDSHLYPRTAARRRQLHCVPSDGEAKYPVSDSVSDKDSSMLLQFMFPRQGGRVGLLISEAVIAEYHPFEKGHNWKSVAAGQEVTMKQQLNGVMFSVA